MVSMSLRYGIQILLPRVSPITRYYTPTTNTIEFIIRYPHQRIKAGGLIVVVIYKATMTS